MAIYTSIPDLNEHDAQAKVIRWAEERTYKYPFLRWLHSSLNGIVIPAPPKVRARIINHMKAEGMKKGIPDLFLPVARRGYHGLYIEMKVGRNKPTPEQEEFANFAHQQGYAVIVCVGSDDAKETLEWYLGETE